jgi:maleate cis-trans isomerase
MFEDSLPEKKIGYLSLRIYIENQAYEFYRLAPPGVMLMLMPCGLREHTVEDVQRVIANLDGLLDHLIARRVDIVLQAGLPVPLLIGVSAHDDLMGHIAEYTGRPAVSQMHNVVAAMKRLAIGNVLVVNRWNDGLNASLARFLARDGIKVAGVSNRILSPEKTSKMAGGDTAHLAYELALAGVKAYPESDGIFLGGSAWLSQPVIERLESETGLPVIANHNATLWDMLRRLGKWQPLPGRGRLLEISE